MTGVTTIRTGDGKNERVRVSARDGGVLLRTKPGIVLSPEHAMQVADALVDYAEGLEQPATTTTTDQS